jgi:4-hydroxy-2-oxoglutarate aldolase
VGGVLAIADCIPELCVEMYRAAAANQNAAARDLQRRVFQVTKNILRKFGIAGLKCAMDHRGYYGGPVRSPLLQANESQRRAVQAAIDSLVAAAAAD